MKAGRRKASFTVEAALVCPFLCLILCGMIVATVSFYEKVESFGTGAVRKLAESEHTATVLRVERMLMEFGE